MKRSLFSVAVFIAAFLTTPALADSSIAADPCESFDFSVIAKKSHPRLLLDDKDFAEIKRALASAGARKANPYALAIHNAIMQAADNEELQSKPLVYQLDASGKRLLTISRLAISKIIPSAYAYRFTGNKKYLRRAEEDLLAVCNFPDWHESHYLDVAEMVTAVAIGYDWLYDRLSPKTRSIICRAVIDYAFGTSVNADTEPWFYKGTNNWNQVCNGGLICAAVAVFETDPGLATKAIRKSIASNRPTAKLIYAPDGAYPEGPGYWNYGTEFQVLAIEALDVAVGTNFDLDKTPGFMNTGYFKLFALGSSGKNFNFCDSGLTDPQSSTLWYFAVKNSDPGLAYLELSRLSQYNRARFPFLALKYSLKLGVGKIQPSSNLVRYFDGINPIVMARSGWENKDAYLGLKAGTPQAGHSHFDAGEFVFDLDGLRWALDYTRPGYAKSEVAMEKLGGNLWDRSQNSLRWRVFGYNNLQHNTLTVNGKDHNVNGHARIVSVLDEPGRVGGTVDFGDTFFDELKSAKRTAVIVGGRGLEVTDELETRSDAPAHIRWTFVTEAKVTKTDKGLVLEMGGRQMLLSASGAGVEYRIWPSSPEEYDMPTKALPAPPETATVCGFEFDIPAGTAVRLTTTLN